MASTEALDRTHLVDEVIEAQRVILHALHRAAEPPWFERELTIAQLKAIFGLARSGAVSMGQLGQSHHLRPPAASVLVDGLVRAGLVQRLADSLDRRRTLVHLTPTAHELVTQMYAAQKDLFESWLNLLPTADLAVLAQGLRTLAAVASPAGTAVS